MIFGGLPALAETETTPVKKDGSTGSPPAGKKAEPAPAAPKTDVAAEHPMAKSFRTVGKVELALLTGQFTRDEQSGIDILLVGDINQAKADKFMAELEKAENKELRYAVLPLDNYRYRLQINDRFINNVLGAKKQVIINTQELEV
jgi:hypothetical protein